MNDKTKRILDKKYGHYLAQYHKADRNNQQEVMTHYTQSIQVLREIYSELTGVPIDWVGFELKLIESVYYSLA